MIRWYRTMGEARRRRRAEATAVRVDAGRRRHVHGDGGGCFPGCVDAEGRHQSGLTFAEIELLASEDPDDRGCREAHGIPYDADWRNPGEACRNGCGLSYEDIVCGKVRACRAVAG